ncbi:class I SAM-dependent DNA methyltransferase, partial [Campylobacter coli]
ILGIDLSKKMIEEAQKRNSGNQIEYRISGLEEYDYPENEWDCVISNLALHYIEDIVEIFQKVYRTLKPGGIFLFNIEHPVFTAGVGQDWIYTDDGKPQYWAIDNYFITGERNTHFLGCDVVKQHHTLTQIIMGLLNNGFELKVVDLHIQISKEDLKILDLLLKANEYSNIVFYCENDEEHFIFTEVKLGNYFCINR